MKISIIIPVHNERDTIAEIIKRIEAVELDKEIIIVDDKSTDGTDKILRDGLSNKDNIKLRFLSKNRGKGFAVRKGLLHAKGKVVIIQDADLEYDPNDYKKLIEPIEQGRESVVYGSRFMNINNFSYIRHWFFNWIKGKRCTEGHLYFSHFLGILVLNFLVLLLYGQKLTDEATCYKVFRREALKSIKLKARRFELCPEVTAKVLKMGYKIYEVPISYYPRSTEHGKKIKWQDGLIAIITLIKYRFMD
jgi:glycosyltransferase involved in cell wall biosynthesis